MDLEKYIRSIWIILGVLSGISIVIAFVRTWSWFSKSGKQVVDLPTIIQLLLHCFDFLSTLCLFVGVGISFVGLVLLKEPNNSVFESTPDSQQNIIKILYAVSFVFKTIYVIHLVIQQTAIDIFFIDWEKPKAGSMNPITAWRTYFVANEFNEIQTFRRIHVPFHLFFTLFILKIVNLENMVSAEPNIGFFSSLPTVNCTTEHISMLRVGTSFVALFGTAIIQYLYYIVFYERFIEDKIMNFVDLCSVSNVSLFILDQNLHGYYIHGRSPHGTADVNIKDMLINLERESQMLSGSRGLQINSAEQLFIVRISRTFRAQYDLLFRSYTTRIGQKHLQCDIHRSADILLQSYQNLNRFLCAYIDCSLPTYRYFIRDRYSLEKIFNCELQMTRGPRWEENTDSLFLIDNEKTFTKVLFYGQETVLYIWNIITFIFIDSVVSNYLLAAIVTFLLNCIVVRLRNSLGRRNLSKKTLIPREFLI